MKWERLKKLAAKIRNDTSKYTVTHQKVRCPTYDCEAALTTHTRQRRGCRAHHVEVLTCSLMPKQEVAVGAKVVWIPDLPYQELNLREGEPSPSYSMGVPCREACLYLVNGEAERDHSQQRGQMMGMYDCLEVERDIAHTTLAATTPIRCPEAFCG